MIDVTDVDLKQFAKDVYDLSVPQGMGFLHFKLGHTLPEEEAEELVARSQDEVSRALDMDYVHGRACKMSVLRRDGRLVINDDWYDHTDHQLRELLSRHGINAEPSGEHGAACNCEDCKIARRKGELD